MTETLSALIKAPAPNDLVKSCKYIEKGTYFALEGMRCCVHADIKSPVLITADEIKNDTEIYDLVVERRRAHFAAVNGWSEAPTGSCLSCHQRKEV